MKKLVYGVGINDRKYPASINGVSKKEYTLWKGMLERCYNSICQTKYPTYIGCTVSNDFKNYSYFFEWCNVQIGFGNESYELDKDLIQKNNKVYSENTCVFLPKELNIVFMNRSNDKSILPIGVTRNGNNFSARCSINGIRKSIGTFTTPELAFNAYKTFKESHIKELAEKYKDVIDPRAYQALLKYEVSIDD